MIQVVYLDFDNTLYSHLSGQIPKSTIKAIEMLHKNKIKVFLCTGRTYSEMKYFDTSKVKLDGMILGNGQVIYDDQDNIIYKKPIEGLLKTKLIEIFKEKQVPLFLSTIDEIIINYVDEKVIEVQKEIDTVVPRSAEYYNEDFFMAAAFIKNNKQRKIIEDLSDIAEITYWHEGAVDIVPKGISKAMGVRVVNEMYGFDMDKTLAIGDGDNDIEMLKDCHIGIAMGNSPDNIKEISDYVTDHIDNDGIYNALKHYKLI